MIRLIPSSARCYYPALTPILFLIFCSHLAKAQTWDGQCGMSGCLTANFVSFDAASCLLTFNIKGTGNVTHLGLYIDQACGATTPDVVIACAGGNCDVNGKFNTFIFDLSTALSTCELAGHTFIVRGAKSGNDCVSVELDGSVNLPVELLYFRGKPEGKTNVLEWATASEINNAVQIVERSASGKYDWEEVGRITPVGNSLEERQYRLEDQAPLDRGYYRLNSIDLDGYQEFSELILIDRQDTQFGISGIFPVPVRETVSVHYRLESPSTMTVTLTDMYGRLLSQQVFNAEAGAGVLEVDLSDKAAGLYYLTLDNGTRQLTEKLIK